MHAEGSKMKLLFYCWGSLYESFTLKIFNKMNIDVLSCSGTMKDYHFDSEFSQTFISALHSHRPEIVFSYNYFPLISMLCEINHIPYACWVYDCPHYTLFSKTLIHPMNFIFCFDRIYSEKLALLGAKNIMHFPLGANIHPNPSILHSDSLTYCCDVSFVGSLYNDSRNQLSSAPLSEYAQGYLNGLAEAQLSVYGFNLIAECLPTSITNEISDKCSLSLNDYYFQDVFAMSADMVGLYITSIERIRILEVLSTHFAVSLFSDSQCPPVLKKSLLQEKGHINFDTELPSLFYNCKINLNMTTKNIQSGIPGRVFDIMGKEGFCMSAYQPELAEYFVDGEEIVLFSNYKELVQKTDYYLSHEKERKNIARNGYLKLKKDFSFEKKFHFMFDSVLSQYITNK